jgi:hypothetical protein
VQLVLLVLLLLLLLLLLSVVLCRWWARGQRGAELKHNGA